MSASAYVDISGVIGNHFQLAAGTIRNALSTAKANGARIEVEAQWEVDAAT